MEGNESPRPRTRALGRAIRRHRGDQTQGELAARLGVSQASVSSWELGGVEFTAEQVSSIEEVLRLLPGTLLLEAGYLDQRLTGALAAAVLALRRLDLALSRLEAVVAEAPSPGC